MTLPVTLQDVYRARRTIAPFVARTPLVHSSPLSAATGARVALKLETVHDVRAFKIRGATNRIRRLTPEERTRGVVTVSTGNHGRAVAHAAGALGVRAVVCMSSLVKENKVAAIRDLGAEIRIAGRSQDEAEVEAERLAREEGLVPVHPFDDRDVIAGQGTIGLELLEDLPEIDCLVCGLSGGGLLGGISVALKAAAPATRIVGVSMERGPAMVESLRAGRPVPVEELETLADSLGGGIGLENRYTYDIVRALVDECVLVSEEEIAAAMRFLYTEERLIAEGGAAVGVAALLHGKVPELSGNVAVVISGSNVDMETFRRIVG